MQTYKLLTLLAGLLILEGCSGIRVSQDYPPDTDYTSLKTYTWQSAKQELTGDLRLDNPLRDGRIRRAVDRLLSEKGYLRVSEEPPDFYVAYHQKIYSRVNVEEAGSGFLFGVGNYGYHGGVGFSFGNRADDYDETLLAIDIIDSGSGDLIWRGTGTRPFVQHTDPQKLTERINQTVQKILSQFPPR